MGIFKKGLRIIEPAKTTLLAVCTMALVGCILDQNNPSESNIELFSFFLGFFIVTSVFFDLIRHFK